MFPTRARRFLRRSLLAAATLSLSILSSGAPRLRADDAAILVAPRELHAGGRSAITLTTLDHETRMPIDRSAIVRLLRGDDVIATLLDGADTGPSGRLHVPFDVPNVESGSVTVEAQVAGVEEPLRVAATLSRTPAVLIETDKPIYRPSQTILGRVLLVDNALRPAVGEVELSIHDARGIRVHRESLTAGEFGVAPFSLDLASEVNFGVWKIRVRSEGVESVRDVRVEEYTLPRFDLSVGFERMWALVDQEITGSVNARFFFGKDVDGDVRITAQRWVGVWEEYAATGGALSGGMLEFTLPAAGFVAGTPTSGGQGSVRVDVSVTDSTGTTQAVTEMLTIVNAPVVVGLIPDTDTLKPGLAATVLVTAKSPDGQPLDQVVRVATTYSGRWGESLGTVRQDVDVMGGVGVLVLEPPQETSYARLTATAERDGRKTTTEIRIGSAYSSAGSFLSLTRLGADAPVRIGDPVQFSAVSTDPGTVFFEVYAGGRTVLSDASEADTFTVTVTPEMMPKAKVVAYKINPFNEVVADTVAVEVEPAGSIAVSASFASDEVKPGEEVELVIDAGTGHRTMIGLSVVDQSVLALGRARLHLAEVFGELERRFLEPQVEVHEGGGGAPEVDVGLLAPDRFFGPPRNFGALDTLRQVGLDIAASSNIRIPEGGVLDWAVLEDVDAVPPRAGEKLAGAGDVRVRQYFPETWVWEPILLTDENGFATMTLTAPDSITGWKLNAVGSSSAGIGFGDGELIVFQDFFVEPTLPPAVTRGEEFAMKVDVFNYLDAVQSVQLTLGGGEWYELLGESQETLTVPAQSATAVSFGIRPTQLGRHDVELTAIGSELSDAVRRPLLVEPEGLPVENVLNGVISAESSPVTLDLTFPSFAVSGSQRAFLNVTPSPVAQTMSGVSDLLGMPYGCGEQNMIFLAPDIEVLKYLREIGELAPEIRAEAEYLVNVGYQRQLTFQTDDGGFAAFGGADGSLWLTAFVLSTFSGAREVRDIDEAVLERAAAMLVSRRRLDGSFQTDDFLIHKEMDGGLENIYAMTAYVTNALADYTEGGFGAADVHETLAGAAEYLEATRTEVADDAYSQSIAAVALLKVPGFETVAEAIIDRLLELALDDGVGIHWEPYPVETTGYAAMALLRASGGAGRPEAGAAIDWLSTQRNALGGYGGSTQDTVVALRALFEAARKVHRDLDLEVTLLSGEEVFWTLRVDAANFDVLHTVRLPIDAPGPMTLRAMGTGSVGYQVAKRFNVPGEELPPPRNMLIDVEYDTEGIEVDDILDVTVRLLYTGFKDATGMVVADVGVPTGFAPVRPSLEAVVEAGLVSRFEIAGRKVIIYIDSLRRDEPLKFTFQLVALFPVRAEGPVSRAFEYYDRQVEAHHRSAPVTVAGEVPETEFRRGDVNVDGAVDISDVTTLLGHLFLGDDPPACLDAADIDDSGRLDITDPIAILGYRFLGQSAPPAPFGECGVDPTPDELECAAFALCD